MGISRPTAYNLLKKNEFRWVQLDGGKYRISKKSFAWKGSKDDILKLKKEWRAKLEDEKFLKEDIEYGVVFIEEC